MDAHKGMIGGAVAGLIYYWFFYEPDPALYPYFNPDWFDFALFTGIVGAFFGYIFRDEARSKD